MNVLCKLRLFLLGCRTDALIMNWFGFASTCHSYCSGTTQWSCYPHSTCYMHFRCVLLLCVYSFFKPHMSYTSNSVWNSLPYSVGTLFFGYCVFHSGRQSPMKHQQSMLPGFVREAVVFIHLCSVRCHLGFV